MAVSLVRQKKRYRLNSMAALWPTDAEIEPSLQDVARYRRNKYFYYFISICVLLYKFISNKTDKNFRVTATTDSDSS